MIDHKAKVAKLGIIGLMLGLMPDLMEVPGPAFDPFAPRPRPWSSKGHHPKGSNAKKKRIAKLRRQAIKRQRAA